VFVTEQGVDMQAGAEAVKKMREAGLGGISARWARALLGAPEPDVGEEVLGGTLWKSPTEEGEKEPKSTPAPGQAAKPEEGESDGPEVSEKAMARAARVYRLDRVLVAAGLRRAA
jgi:phage gp29-like protein